MVKCKKIVIILIFIVIALGVVILLINWRNTPVLRVYFSPQSTEAVYLIEVTKNGKLHYIYGSSSEFDPNITEKINMKYKRENYSVYLWDWERDKLFSLAEELVNQSYKDSRQEDRYYMDIYYNGKSLKYIDRHLKSAYVQDFISCLMKLSPRPLYIENVFYTDEMLYELR